jgi:hypothetical protein
MSTLAEIQEAITKLPIPERNALAAWLNSQAPSALDAEDEAQLLRSLEAAKKDLDNGKGVPLEDARRLIASWAGR